MHALLNIAVKGARKAGKIIIQNSFRIDRVRFNAKGKSDYVSEIDRLAEAEIVDVIRQAYPSHAITAEEEHQVPGDEYEWIIDPLDGTTNYLHGIPRYGVSIAVRHRTRLQHAVIYDPVLDELFTASRGDGAKLNDRRIRCSSSRNLGTSVVSSGLVYRAIDELSSWLEICQEIALTGCGIRRTGSAALDLAAVAAGRHDGYWESGLKIWDVAAGALLVQEAGGMVCDFLGEDGYLESGRIIASNRNIHHDLLTIVSSKTRESSQADDG